MALSPMMQLYVDTKEQYKDCLLFYRLGDFYEMFFDDAILASRELEITLTAKDCGLSEKAPMCGVPYHSVNTYINKLLAKDYKVAICEQLSDPKAKKGLVERGVVRVITPGTVIEDSLLSGKENNYLAAVALSGADAAIAWADVSTGEFNTCAVSCQKSFDALINKLYSVSPNEIIVNSEFMGAWQKLKIYVQKQFKAPVLLDNGEFDNFSALAAHFSTAAEIKKDSPECAVAASGLWSYLQATQKNELCHMREINVLQSGAYLELDSAAIKNLELFKSMSGGRRGSVLWLIDKTQTPMGGREIKKWLERPLRSRKEIEARLDAVQEITQEYSVREDVKAVLAEISDIERISTRVAYGTVNAREAAAVGKSLQKLPQLKALLSGCGCEFIKRETEQIDVLSDICELLNTAIADTPPETIKDGGIIREGFSDELDGYRGAVKNGQKWILELEAREREATGIKTLKIKFNRVFGYAFEVGNASLSLVPYRFVRRQTLSTGERFITEELKELEEKILGAEEKATALEYAIFCEIRARLLNALERLRKTAHAIAVIDCILSLALVAGDNNYVRPSINTEGKISILNGRHPVVEAINGNNTFVPNDTGLDTADNRFMIITGPNMAGKSTYMRQVALITLLAHMGSFVPASSADINICDRIFTRVGASDDLSAGQSTFMVEMNEVAGILNNATCDSLVILDEIGRGTSTFDGLSIAWAVTEYLADSKVCAKTLFATHYHELSELEGRIEGVKNYCVTVREHGKDVIFLRKIMRGSVDKSFGIAVARLAGIPENVLDRAKQVLLSLEKADISKHATDNKNYDKKQQMSLFASPISQEICDEIKNIDINTLTPVGALNILCELREKARREDQ